MGPRRPRPQGDPVVRLPEVVRLTVRVPPAPERLEAWGLARAVWARVERPRTVAEAAEALDRARRDRTPVALRGAGNSYGDAALLDGGVVLDLSGIDRILEWDRVRGRAVVEPGVTVEALWRRTLPDGWWPAVVPGTMRPTWGGCAAMNVHGKNHWRAGALDSHVEALELLTPALERLACSRDSHADLFRAALGGAGLLGLVTRLELRLQRVRSGLLEVEAFAARSLEGAMDVIETLLDRFEHLVAWIDAFDASGRGLVHAARPLEAAEDPDPGATLRPGAQDLPPRVLGLPRAWARHALAALLSDAGMRLVNAAKWGWGRAAAGGRYRQAHAAFHFLLDYVPEWRRAYLPGGLVQYQPFVPRAAARRVFGEILRLSRSHGRVPYLAVVKRHRPAETLLSPYLDGWSLALDYRVPAEGLDALRSLLRETDRLVAEAGGRFYFAKDLTMTPETFLATCPPEALASFRSLKERCDPDGLLATDLSRRLGLG